MRTIDHKLAETALEYVEGSGFEKFGQTFFSAIIGSNFRPLGGNHDGGADGFFDSGIYEQEEPTHFLQISIEENVPSKIKRTHQRLVESGRTPKRITYLSSRVVPMVDRMEIALSNELGINVQIKDRKYIVGLLNNSDQTVQAFHSYLEPAISFLTQMGSSSIIPESRNLPSRALCVFLQQEVENRSGNTELLESVTDSLILWSLEGTDPMAHKFMSKEDIKISFLHY